MRKTATVIDQRDVTDVLDISKLEPKLEPIAPAMLYVAINAYFDLFWKGNPIDTELEIYDTQDTRLIWIAKIDIGRDGSPDRVLLQSVNNVTNERKLYELTREWFHSIRMPLPECELKDGKWVLKR